MPKLCAVRNLSVLIPCLLPGLLFAAEGENPQPANTPLIDQPTSVTEVIILGTIHEDHLKNTQYTVDDVKQIMLRLKPTAILEELPLKISDKPTIENDRIADWLVKGADTPEVRAVNPVADALNIPVYPFDRPDRQEVYARTNYFPRQGKSSQALNQWLSKTMDSQTTPSLAARVVMQWYEVSQGFNALTETASPRILNSEGVDRIVRVKHSMCYDIVPAVLEGIPELKEAAEVFRFFGQEWTERNKIMAENIERIAHRYPGRRLVVLTGLEHRYMLRDLLGKNKAVALKEFWEVAP